MMQTDPLSFENCAADVAKMLGKSVASALDLANAYQRNLGWDEKKLFARAQDIEMIQTNRLISEREAADIAEEERRNPPAPDRPEGF